MTKIKKKFLYKYKLREKIFSLPFDDHKLIMVMLPKILGINKRTFEKYIYTKVSEKYEMPAGHLAVISSYLNCTMEDMFNSLPTQYSLMSFGMGNKYELAKNLNLKK